MKLGLAINNLFCKRKKLGGLLESFCLWDLNLTGAVAPLNVPKQSQESISHEDYEFIKIVNLGSAKTDLFYECKKYGFKKSDKYMLGIG